MENSLGPAPVRQTHTQVFSPQVRAPANGGRSRCAGGSDQSLEVSCPNVGKRGPGCTVRGWAGRELSPDTILRLQISWAFWKRGDAPIHVLKLVQVGEAGLPGSSLGASVRREARAQSDGPVQ